MGGRLKSLFVKVVVANFKIQLYSPMADHPIILGSIAKMLIIDSELEAQ